MVITTEFSNEQTSLTRYPREYDETIAKAQGMALRKGMKLSKTAVVGLSLALFDSVLEDIQESGPASRD